MLQVVSTGSEEALPGASAFATLDREGVIVGRGERFELLAKWLTQRECRVGMSLEHWLPARSAKAWRSLLARAFEGVGTSQRELVECGPNGLREVELSFEPPSATGTELVLMVLRDCSGERRLTQGCLRARAELAAMLEASAGPAWIVDQRLPPPPARPGRIRSARPTLVCWTESSPSSSSIRSPGSTAGPAYASRPCSGRWVSWAWPARLICSPRSAERSRGAHRLRWRHGLR